MQMNEINTALDQARLSNTTLLVRLKRSMWQPYAFDEDATNAVVARSGVAKAGRFNKRLFLDCPDVTNTNAAFNEVYRYIAHNTVPWMDDGWRWMPATLYVDVAKGAGERINECRARVARLEAKWPQLVAADMQRLGPMANADDYPAHIGDKYAIDLRFSPVPDVNDFRVAISEEDRESLNRAVEDAKANAGKYLLAEMLEPIKKAADKLRVPIGHDGSLFRDSLMENIADALARARKLNFTDDPDVRSMIDNIQAAMGGYIHTPDRLREDVGARNDARAKLDAIMSKMSGLF